MSVHDREANVPLYAGFWRRGAASLLDGIILIIPGVAITVLLPDQMVLHFVVGTAIACAYYAAFHSAERQATPGKMAFGIKVTGLDGERISLPRAVGRYFATWISGIVFLIGYLMAAFTKRRQALHDLLAGTYVVNAKATPEETLAGGDTMPLTGGVLAMVLLLFIVPFFGGIVAAIAIPAYADYVVRAKVVEVVNAATPLQDEVARAYADKRSWPTGSVPIASPQAKGASVSEDGVISVTMLGDRMFQGGTIRFVPEAAGSDVRWKCSSADIPPKYLPVRCR